MARRKRKQCAENPFKQELIEDSVSAWKSRTIRAENGTLLVTNPRTGEIPDDLQAGRGLVVAHKVEANEFIKIYAKGIQAMTGLSTSGLKVLGLFLKLVRGGKPNKDRVSLYYPALTPEEREQISYRVFLNGINNLIDKRFIAESLVPNEFFLNPTYLYNGNRLALIKLYEVRDDEEEEEPSEAETEYYETHDGHLVEQKLLPGMDKE